MTSLHNDSYDNSLTLQDIKIFLAIFHLLQYLFAFHNMFCVFCVT